LGRILWVPSYIHSSKRQIKHFCHRLGCVYLEGDAFWNKKWTSNILESYHKNIQKEFVQFCEDIPRWFHRRNIMTWRFLCKISNYAFKNARSIEAT